MLPQQNLPQCLDMDTLLGMFNGDAQAVSTWILNWIENSAPAIIELQRIVSGNVEADNCKKGGIDDRAFNHAAFGRLLHECRMLVGDVAGASTSGHSHTLSGDGTWIATSGLGISHIGPGSEDTTFSISSDTGNYLSTVTVGVDAKRHALSISGATSSLPTLSGDNLWTQASGWTLSHIGPQTQDTTFTVSAGTGYFTSVTIGVDAKRHVLSISGATASMPSGGSTAGRYSMPPGAWYPVTASSGLTSALRDYTGGATSAPVYDRWRFGPGDDSYVQTQMRLPSNYTAGKIPMVLLDYYGTDAPTGTDNVLWSVEVMATGATEPVTAATFDVANTATSPAISQNNLGQATVAATSSDGAVAKDFVTVRLGRKGTDGADTYAGDVWMIAGELTYEKSATE